MPGVLREYWNGGFTEYIECTFSDKGFKKKLKIIHQCYQNMLVRRVKFLKNRNIRNTRFDSEISEKYLFVKEKEEKKWDE